MRTTWARSGGRLIATGHKGASGRRSASPPSPILRMSVHPTSSTQLTASHRRAWSPTSPTARRGRIVYVASSSTSLPASRRWKPRTMTTPLVLDALTAAWTRRHTTLDGLLSFRRGINTPHVHRRLETSTPHHLSAQSATATTTPWRIGHGLFKRAAPQPGAWSHADPGRASTTSNRHLRLVCFNETAALRTRRPSEIRALRKITSGEKTEKRKGRG